MGEKRPPPKEKSLIKVTKKWSTIRFAEKKNQPVLYNVNCEGQPLPSPVHCKQWTTMIEQNNNNIKGTRLTQNFLQSFENRRTNSSKSVVCLIWSSKRRMRCRSFPFPKRRRNIKREKPFRMNLAHEFKSPPSSAINFMRSDGIAAFIINIFFFLPDVIIIIVITISFIYMFLIFCVTSFLRERKKYFSLCNRQYRFFSATV